MFPKKYNHTRNIQTFEQVLIKNKNKKLFLMATSVIKINMETCVCASIENKQQIKGNEKQGHLIDFLTCKAMDPKHSFNRSSLLLTMSSNAIFLRRHSSNAYKDQTK